MDQKTWQQPPSRAVVAYKDEDGWTPIDDSFTFRFSMHPRSHIEVTKPSGEILSGYFQGMDRSTGAISLFNHRDSRRLLDDNGNSTRGVGAKTLLTIKKYSVDRFGRRAEVKSEVRTWHGEACTSPTPPD